MRSAAVTYGLIVQGTDGQGRAAFAVRAVPHVAQKLKRVFVRANAGTPGVIFLRDTLEVGRDLAWFMERWPLAASEATAGYIAARAAEHQATEQAVAAILDGYVPPNGWREPILTPRGYQLAADAIVHRTGWLLLADDLGLGKTFTAALRLRDPEALPAVVVCPPNLCGQWQRELAKAMPWLRTHIATKGTPYDPAAKRGSDGRQPDVLILSYPKLAGWADHLAGTAQTIIFDECHELRTGEGTYKWAAAANVSWKARYRIGCSATPVHGYGDEIWNVIAVLNPDALGARTEFVREWCGGTAGMADHRLVSDPSMLGGYLRDSGMMLARTRKELHMELPDPITIEQPVDTNHATIDEVARQVAHQARILVGDVAADFAARGQAAREIDWKMRQVTGVAKAPFVAEFIKLLLESEERVVVWAWHRECFAPGTKVLIHDGTVRNVEDIRVGDRVMGPDSRARLVKSLTRGHGNLYRVVPNKGEPWMCSENHIMTVRNSRSGACEHVTARQFAESSARWQHRRTLFRAEAVTFPDSQPVLEPWLMGYWLGDGAASLRDLRVTSADLEIEAEIHSIAVRHGLSVNTWDAPGESGTSRAKHLAFSSGLAGPKDRNRLLRHFQSLGLHQNKHVPHCYATASLQDRRELLAGLIDSDGHVSLGNGVGTATYSTGDRQLAENVAYVARSLGLAAYIKPKSQGGGFASTKPRLTVFIRSRLSVPDERTCSTSASLSNHLAQAITTDSRSTATICSCSPTLPSCTTATRSCCAPWPPTGPSCTPVPRHPARKTATPRRSAAAARGCCS